jgi:hypothetical protein
MHIKMNTNRISLPHLGLSVDLPGGLSFDVILEAYSVENLVYIDVPGAFKMP